MTELELNKKLGIGCLICGRFKMTMILHYQTNKYLCSMKCYDEYIKKIE